MVKKASRTIHARLKSAVDSWVQWPQELTERPRLERQLGGASNSTFLVISGEKAFAIRLNTQQLLPGLNRAAERWALGQSGLGNIVPSLVYWTPEFIVSAYQQGEQFDLARHSELLPKIARQLAQVHSLPVPEFPALDPFAHLSDYLENRQIVRTELLNLCEASVRKNRPTSKVYRLCHNDLNPGNILVTTTGIVFLDWEYANVTSPAFDIAVFAATQGLTNQQLETFLDFYGGTANIASVKYYQRLYGLLEILWWRLKTGNQEAMESALAQFLDER